jgi:hypothetical protein
MPFTFAHPAIVLPLKNKYFSKYFSLTGLAVGSILPDFEYFIRMKMVSNYSHTILGLFLFNLPLGIIFCFIFHNIIRNDLFINMPYFLRTRLCIYTEFNWNQYFLKNPVLIIFSLLIGSFSHLLWDSFTHFDGYFVETINFLSYSITISHVTIPVYKILQHLSSLLGCLIIFCAIIKLPKYNILNEINYKYWVAICLTVLIICIIKVIMGLNYKLYGELIVVFISALLIAVIIVPIVIKIFTVRNLLKNEGKHSV